jgi:hypothetical protein
MPGGALFPSRRGDSGQTRAKVCIDDDILDIVGLVVDLKESHIAPLIFIPSIS